jgi:hypothetical protein
MNRLPNAAAMVETAMLSQQTLRIRKLSLRARCVRMRRGRAVRMSEGMKARMEASSGGTSDDGGAMLDGAGRRQRMR